MKAAFYLFISLLLFSCKGNDKPGHGILSHEQMESVLWEQMKANSFATEFIIKDSTKNPQKEDLLLQEKIFQKYHTTKEEFYRSYDYYLNHSSELQVILDSMAIKQSRLHDLEAVKKTTDTGNVPRRRINIPAHLQLQQK